MALHPRISIDPAVMLGKPVIRGTRIPVELLLRKLSEGATIEVLIDAYPHLTADDVRAAMAYAADAIADEETMIEPRRGASPEPDRVRFLADESCDGLVIRELRGAGHDVLRAVDHLRGASDAVVIRAARDDGRVLITEDRDFGHLVFAGASPRPAWSTSRWPIEARAELARRVVATVAILGDRLTRSFVTIRPQGVRIRLHPQPSFPGGCRDYRRPPTERREGFVTSDQASPTLPPFAPSPA